MFYITKEMDSLLKEGLMPVDMKQPQYIRLRSGSESNGYWAALLAGVCVSASDIGAAVLAGLEVMATAAGYCLLAVAGCLLLTGDTEINSLSFSECLDLYDACQTKGGPNTIPQGSMSECGYCFNICKEQKYWSYSRCPLY
jgi:hypothetical protein